MIRVIENIAPPPVTLAEAMAYARIDDPAAPDNAVVLPLFLRTAQAMCESYVDQAFSRRTLEIDISYTKFARNRHLPYGPVQEILSVTDLATGAAQLVSLFAGSSFIAEYDKGMVINNTWKDDGYDGVNPFLDQPFTVRYATGYPDGQAPDLAKLAIMQTFEFLYRERGSNSGKPTLSELPGNAKQSLWPLKELVL